MRTVAEVESSESLRVYLSEGDTVYVIVRSVSQSGLSRRMSFFAFEPGSARPVDLDYWIGHKLGLKRKKGEQGLVVSGCGMDMGLHVVSNLAHKLFGDERALKHEFL